jgi:hypothetical protein
VNGPHIEGVAENEIDPLLGAQVGQPVPGEHALAADYKAGAIGFYQSEESFRFGRDILVNDHLSDGIEDADIHGVGVQIDAAVEPVLFRVEFHGAGSFP